MGAPQRATADWVAQTADERHWSGLARSRALHLVLQPPNAAEWRVFLDQLLLIGGATSLLLGVIFFVAANWAGLGAYSKFLLIDAGIVGSAFLAYRSGLDSLAGKWALTLASGLVGTFLALYGQTYQTGADPYWLFLGWAALILPWCLAARHAPLWAGWVILVNTALGLALPNSLNEETRISVVTGFNFLLAVLTLATGCGRFEVPWTLGLLAATFGGVFAVIDSRFLGNSEAFGGLSVWLIYGAASCAYFYRRRSLAELAAVGFSIIFVDTFWLGSSLWRVFDGLSEFFVMGVFVIAQVSALAAFLRSLRARA